MVGAGCGLRPVVGGGPDASGADVAIEASTADAGPDVGPVDDGHSEAAADASDCTCSIANGEGRCGEGGACELVRCRPGYGDCNGDLTDGCEVNLGTDVQHCGMCGAACRAASHATVTCAMGMCGFGRCTDGYADCNGRAEDGCEADTRSSPAHCGMCGQACAAPSNATATCDRGACGFACAPGFADCDRDASNGCEVDTRTASGHCGACGNNCSAAGNATATCVAGRCEFGACDRGYGNCDGSLANGCETPLATNRAHCGACGNACAADQVCSEGRCAAPCPREQTRCAGVCVPLQNDPLNCGACGNACAAGQLCGAGRCVGLCGPGETLCGRACVALASDRLHCGACGRVCPGDESCVAGACRLVCPAGQTICDGRCVDLQNDPAACGACGTVCPASDTCVAGRCQLLCPPGQTACGRQCISLDRNPDHCGACGRVCVAGCVMGACARPQDVTLVRDATCVLYTSGRVFCYGRANGVIPLAASGTRQIAGRQITDSIGRPLEDVLELVGGDDRACGRMSTGAVACFGASGTVGLVAGVSGATSVSGRGTNFLAATTAGSVWSWNGLPRAASAPAVAVAGIGDALAVAAGVDFGCVLRRDGTVACWGANGSGQLGDGSTTARTSPVAVAGLTSVTALTAGRAHVCAQRSNGTVWCWGANGGGQLGDGSLTNRGTASAVVGLSGVRSVRAGLDHTCAVLTGGAVRCWGANGSAQVSGAVAAAQVSAPVAVAGLTTATAVNGYEHHSCAVNAAAEVYCWGDNAWGEVSVRGTEGQCEPARVTGLSGVTQLVSYAVSGAEGGWFKCALQGDGRVFCWTGAAGYAPVLGDGSTSPRVTPRPVSGVSDATQLTAGGSFVCVLRRGGTVACWGRNAEGQLGQAGGMPSAVPVAVSGLTGVAEVRAGRAHACARTTDNRVACWGYNYDGQLGRGTTGNSPVPTFVPALAGARSLVVGADHACAVMGDGRVLCWGQNSGYQIGDGTTTHAFSPAYTRATGSTATAPVFVTGVTRLGTLYDHTWGLGVLASGAPVALRWGVWGPAASARSTLAVLDTNDTVNLRSLSPLGFGVSCSVSAVGAMTCGGVQEFCQVGSGAGPASTATGVVAGTWSSVEYRGDGPPCAINDRGEVLCWGPRRDGNLASVGLDSLTRAPARMTLLP
jgi:alpha-tubulin suppressor-like RCC1 family protein